MRVSVVQMNPGADKMQNIAQAGQLMAAAIAADHPDMLVLPEVWSCLGGDRATKFRQAEALPPPGSNQPGGPAYEFLRDVARRNAVHVHGGSIMEMLAGDTPGDHLFNTTLVFDPEGQEIARYRKIHLFDIVGPDGAGYRESATFGAGDAVVTYQVGALTIGCAICYDLRFPELFAALRAQGAHIIMLPAAFTLHTGKDHWEVLLRARAIETQCWMAAAGTTGAQTEGNGETRYTYGNSLVCDPWGQVVARASEGQGFATARIDPELGARLRRDMPVAAHRQAWLAAFGQPA